MTEGCCRQALSAFPSLEIVVVMVANVDNALVIQEVLIDIGVTSPTGEMHNGSMTELIKATDSAAITAVITVAEEVASVL